jgi:hypothetical protein
MSGKNVAAKHHVHDTANVTVSFGGGHGTRSHETVSRARIVRMTVRGVATTQAKNLISIAASYE